MFIANTWRTLGRISQPQGCDYTVFLTSATFSSHPKTHDCNANKGHTAALSSSGSFGSALVTSGAGVCVCCSCAGESGSGRASAGGSLNKCTGLPALSIRYGAAWGASADFSEHSSTATHKAAFVCPLNLRPLLQRRGRRLETECLRRLPPDLFLPHQDTYDPSFPLRGSLFCFAQHQCNGPCSPNVLREPKLDSELIISLRATRFCIRESCDYVTFVLAV